MQNIKTFLAVSLASMLAYFEPIGDILTSITILFLLNFVFGLLAGLLAHRETFNFRKSLRLHFGSLGLSIVASFHLFYWRPPRPALWCPASRFDRNLYPAVFLFGKYFQELESAHAK